MARWAVMYMVENGDAGANPFGHSVGCVIRLNEDTNQWEVMGHPFGYYGMESDSTNYPLKTVKSVLKLHFDWEGGCGGIYDEEQRYMDTGKGLSGFTLEISEDQAKDLLDHVQQQKLDQDAAMSEHAQTLGIQPKADFKRNKYEGGAWRIFQAELNRVGGDFSKSRIPPFGYQSKNPAESSHCKIELLKTLSRVLSPKQVKQLEGGCRYIPRFSGPLNPIILRSTGPLSAHKKSSGETVYFRDQTRDDVRLVLAVTPENLQVPGELCHGKSPVAIAKITQLASTLVGLEWDLVNASFPEAGLLERIRAIYPRLSQKTSEPSAQVGQSWFAGAADLEVLIRDCEMLIMECESALTPPPPVDQFEDRMQEFPLF